MELASTLAKNAKELNPFEIVLLQFTRKGNNWKTEETSERAAVTLETERIKGPTLDVYDDDEHNHFFWQHALGNKPTKYTLFKLILQFVTTSIF